MLGFMKKLLVLCAALFTVSIASAQANYDYSIGLRLGYGADISFKWNMNSTNTLETLLRFPEFRGVNATCFYEWNWDVISPGFQLYAGPGASLGIISEHHGWWTNNGTKFHKRHTFGTFGLGGIVGLQYTFNIPLSLSIDYSPMVQINMGRTDWVCDRVQTWGLYDFKIGIRYCF